MGVFISQDAGLNWSMVERGRHIFEIINNGSVIVMAPKTIPTMYVKYSLDGGNTWKKL
jgi:hypothetical protein